MFVSVADKMDDETYEDPLDLMDEIDRLKEAKQATILAHYYVDGDLQDIADFTGDSLRLARQTTQVRSSTIVFCGVHFMAETAAIISPEKRVLLPDLRAGCSLAASITAADVRKWRDEFPDYVAVGYVNTTAEVKAELDYCCTSGNVLAVIDAIPEERGILFLPDFFLGAHIKRQRPNRKLEVWMGECHVHKGITARTVNAKRAEYPDAEVLVHPECGCAGQLIYAAGLGDIDSNGLHIASTEGMIRLAKERPANTFIVATEVGILHRMQQLAPDKTFLAADPEAVCTYMKTINLDGLRDALREDPFHVTLPEEMAARARLALNRMIQLG